MLIKNVIKLNVERWFQVDFLNELKMIFLTIRITDVIDVLVMTFILYKLILLVKETRALQLANGLLIIFIFSKIAQGLRLYTVNWLISNIFTAGMILIVVVFQPELRRLFEKLGKTNNIFKSLSKFKDNIVDYKIDDIIGAVASLSRQKIGALIVIEQENGLRDIVETGTSIGAEISSELLISLFFPKSPLHDGAVVIKEDKILAAGCFLPLSENYTISKELGTRHRAGIGMSEKSDAFIIIVSEETGVISTVHNNQLSRNIDPETLREILNKLYVDEETQANNEVEGVENGNN